MENLFLVCLIPPVSIADDINEIRTYIADKFNVRESLKRPAHITLYPPVKLSGYDADERFFKALTDASFNQRFTQVLQNFNSFPEHTFYLDVEQNEGLMLLEKQITKALQPLKLIGKKEKFNPHLTLAFRDIKPVFKQICAEFKDRKFKREFEVSSFSVYKHVDKRWQPFKELPFKDPDTKPKTLTLFD
ncbi:2'-5' RNA ligase family protein [Pedobacter suwonensis]|uniref:2'-5' RNA ligase family protein n=1 Tax=Pedobacter suwonensis TaxID=332999 RepID=UPI00119E5F13|nr:2'-5' RNA ligase family protein [Pedobacter suwonensis]